MPDSPNGGSITVEDGLKAAQEYAPARKVSVTLTFDIAKDANPKTVLEYVGNLVNNQVRALLHQQPEVIIEKADHRGPIQIATEAALAAAEAAPQDRATVGTKLDPGDLSATDPLIAGTPAKEAEKAKRRAARKGTTEAEPPGSSGTTEETGAAAPASDPGDLSTVNLEPPAEKIATKELHDQITRWLGAHPGKVKEVNTLIRAFAPKDFPETKTFFAADIHTGDRPRFLEELKALA